MPMNNKVIAAMESDLEEKGWAVFPLIDPSPVYSARALILDHLRIITEINDITLETYHDYFDSDEDHYEIQKQIAAYARKEGFAKEIVQGQIDLFKAILGPDIAITKDNNWRIARPEKTQDNVGFHRDIEIGHTAFELNLWFPLVDVGEGSSLKLMSGSHEMPREKFPYYKAEHPSISQGSDLNRLGFFYAPHVYDSWFETEMKSTPMDVGYGLMFLASAMHGQIINQGTSSRWSTDFVIANSLAPIDWIHHIDQPKYEVLTESVTVRVGKMFHDLPGRT